MKHVRKRFTQILPAALLVTIAATAPASAAATPKPLTDPTKAAALADKLGNDRTGGVYYEDGRLVVAVTDQRAAQTVRDAGGMPKLVTRSTADLESIHRKLDQLGGIANTAWGVEASSNQVSVEIFDGVSAVDRTRIAKVAAAYPGAVRVDRIKSKLRFKVNELRGGVGIVSQSYLCSAGFNTKNSSGQVFTLTAGHCGYAGHDWYLRSTAAEIGLMTASGKGGIQGDWATIRADGPEINTHGTVRYGVGDYRQIDNSRYPVAGEPIDRAGTNSTDTTGYVTKEFVTVTIGGVQMEGMFESNVCALGGDSGGPALRGSTALGLLSGGTDETVCNSSSGGTYRNFFTPVQRVLNDRGLHVY